MKEEEKENERYKEITERVEEGGKLRKNGKRYEKKKLKASVYTG